VLRAVYARDPSFVHPDVAFLRRVMDGRAAFLRHGAARAFAIPGRAFALAFVDPRVQEKTGAAVGSIGFLEAVSEEAATGVLDPAWEWLASRGVREAWTPFNGNPFFGVGLREDRFDESPFVGCAHQPSRYRSFLEGTGFHRITAYLNYEIDLTGDAWRDAPGDVDGVTFRRASRQGFRDEVMRFMRLHNDAFREVWGEAEVSPEEAVELMGRARLAVVPELFQFAVSPTGDDIGMVLCMPNVNEVLAPQRRPITSPSGVAKMAVRRRRVRTLGLLSVGVHPAHQGRGIGTALVARACHAAARLGYRTMEYALVADSNDASKSTVARFGGKLCRTFGVYAKEL
jgi:GNAT superfamily N-acetyltransferase